MGVKPVYAEAARDLGQAIAQAGYELVYGGGSIGLMGVVADAAMAAGGKVIGVIPTELKDRELGHSVLTELRVVEDMHERKALMAELSDGFIALPGGYGTLEEFCEVLTWSQLKLHTKPFGLLNIAGYYDHFLAFLDHAVGEGLIKAKHRGLVLAETRPEDLVATIFSPRVNHVA